MPNCQKHTLGQRVAHGLLGLSIASGLAMRTGMLEGTVIAFREINNWKFITPIFIGDTIHVVMEVAETKALPRIGGGSVVITLDVKKQSGETAMKGNWTVLVMSGRKEACQPLPKIHATGCVACWHRKTKPCQNPRR
jgi:acyl dehydratase